MNIKEIIEEFENLYDPTSIEGMKRGGIDPEKAYGIKIPVLRKMAKKIRKNRDLAQQLWELGYRETMILAGMIDDPVQVTEKQMDNWISSPYFSYWEIVDQTCMNLFYLTENAYKKAIEWSTREGEFEKRASFALIAVLAWKDKTATDSRFEDFFPIIKRESIDNRNNVKKAVNWALRQIGKRNLYLNSKALKVAREILEIDSKSSNWIARDAIKELESEAIQERLKQQE
ncbi:MAG: DNA alkylation repair protein [Candidatus Thorarchaeota archaeon]